MTKTHIALIATIVATAFTHAGEKGNTANAAFTGSADRAIVRAQEDILTAKQDVALGDIAMKERRYQDAYLSYMDALDKMPQDRVRRGVVDKFSNASLSYAKELAHSGRFHEAEMVAKTNLLSQYAPGNRAMVRFLSNLEQPDVFNKTISPAQGDENSRVATLLAEAQAFFDVGRFDIATNRYEQVLLIDRYNSAARKGMERVNKERTKYYNAAYNHTRSELLWQVDKAMTRPLNRYANIRESGPRPIDSGTRGNEATVAKLNNIRISVNFNETTVRDAINFLSQRSRALDTATEDSTQKRGVNIVLRLPITPIVDEDGTPVESGTAETPITLQLTNVPLIEALRYVTDFARLKFKIEQHAVVVLPATVDTSELYTKEFKVPPGFIPATAQEAPSIIAPGTSLEDITRARLGGGRNAKKFLEEQGIVFPDGAFAQFVPAGSRLVVRNTADNLDLIDFLVEASGLQNTQVEIETKFIEVTQTNLDELSFDHMLGPIRLGNSAGRTYHPNYLPYLDSNGNPTSLVTPNPNPMYPLSGRVLSRPSTYGLGGGELGYNATGDRQGNFYPFGNTGMFPVTDGIRTGTGTSPNSAIAANGVDALLAGILQGSSAAAPGILGLSGILNGAQYQTVIRALNQRKGADLMSAPRVTTQSGKKATIRLIREFPYPTEFNPPEIPTTATGTAYFVDDIITLGAGQIAVNASPVTPSTPTKFEVRNVGVTLEVEPTVSSDNYTIELNLAPEVVEFDGFINYGSPVMAPRVVILPNLLNPDPNLSFIETYPLTPNVINQPIFSVRKVRTNVSVWDGQTLVLGGLIREDVQKTNDKVPLLGDVPGVGRLFRGNSEQKIKRNLMIFVTSRILDAEGRPLRQDLDVEEQVMPIGLPPDRIAPAAASVPMHRFSK